MANKGRWLVALLPLCFVALVLAAALRLDPDLWRSTSDLCRLAQEAAGRGEQRRALELARKAWSREPKNPGIGTLLAKLYLSAGETRASLEVSRQTWHRNPKATEALKLQAQALDLLGEREKAYGLLDGYLKDRPEEAEIIRSGAEIAARHPEDHPLAVSYYQKLYSVAPDPQVRRRLLDLLVSEHRYQEAIPLQEQEAAELPDSQEALHRLALLYYWQRDYQAAAQIYQRLLERAAQDGALRLEAAQVADAAQDLDQALAHYLWLYGHNNGKKEYAVALARLWSRKGNHAEAAGVLAPLMEGQAEHELRRWYGLELLLTGDFPRARKAYETAWKEGDTHQETIVNLARLYAQERQFARAAGFWDEAGRRQLLNPELRWEAALTYSYARRYSEAVQVLKPVDRQDPKLLLFLGQLHFYQEDWAQAAHYFKAYLEKIPQDGEVRRQLAEALSFKPENREAALEEYGKVLKEKDDVSLRLRRISLLLQAKRWEAAARELKECPTPADPQLIREQAHLFLWLGDLEAALKHYDLFLQKVPQDQQGRLEKARILTYLGRFPEAVELLTRLRADYPKDPGVRLAAIQAYLSFKDFPKALALAQKELEPLDTPTLEERALLARCYCHSKNPRDLNRATELLLQNLHKDRNHHPSLLMLASVLPRLPRYEDLDRVMDRVPGLRQGGPESSALAYFDSQMGRQGGKLNYLLHVLEECRRHRWPDSPGELLGLAWLAMELGETHAAAGYYRKALTIKPNDKSIARLLLQCQMAQKDWGQALATLRKEGARSDSPLEVARLYMLRGQYEGVKAAVAEIPADSPQGVEGLRLLAQACRLEGNYPEALKVLSQLEGKIPRTDWLMEKAQVLEAMGDRGAVGLYEEIVKTEPESQAARVAKAREARARKDWAGAQQAYAQALKDAPQDIGLLNELEYVRQQMRPQMASRGFPDSRGQHRPEEAVRPWQFSRFGQEREPLRMGLSNLLPAVLVDVLPIVQPESLFLTDSNKLYGGIFRLSGGFWITKVLPARLGVEYREYNQNTKVLDQSRVNLGLYQVFNQETTAASRLRRVEASLGLGPLAVTERLRISGEVILRRYWKRVDLDIAQQGQQREWIQFPLPPHLLVYPQTAFLGVTQKEDRNRLFGSLELGFPWGSQTDVTLKYSRRDIFDQDAHLYPRLFQGVLNLEKARLTGLHQVEAAFDHQIRPGLNWQGNLGGAFFSDQNSRLTLYQGLTWQAVREPRMGLEFTPHYYLAAYADRREAYFSPHSYHALGLGLDFYRQIFRLPTLILQTTVQGVSQHGQWGPAFHGLAALEWEFVQNFYTDLHVFYFREWIDQYHLLAAGASFRWRF